MHGAAGGVGSLAVQIAKALGAGQVIATAGSDERRAYARSIGADVAVDYAKPDWPTTVLDATGGRGVDIILESIGGDIFEQNFECLATFSRYVIFGSTRGPGAPFAPRRLMTRCQTMTGIYVPVFFAQRPDLVLRGTGIPDRSLPSGSAPSVLMSRWCWDLVRTAEATPHARRAARSRCGRSRPSPLENAGGLAGRRCSRPARKASIAALLVCALIAARSLKDAFSGQPTSGTPAYGEPLHADTL